VTGGRVICGKAPINRITGGTGTAQSLLICYGELFLLIIRITKYLRIEYAGAVLTAKEFNGLYVGSGNNNMLSFHSGADDDGVL
jgi:hypothetical protein